MGLWVGFGSNLGLKRIDSDPEVMDPDPTRIHKIRKISGPKPLKLGLDWV